MNNTQRDLVDAIEGMGDVLVYEAGRNRQRFVMAGLERLGRIFDQFVEMRETNRDRFQALHLSQELIELSKKDIATAVVELLIYPRHHLIVLDSLINQFRRVHDEAVGVYAIRIWVTAFDELVGRAKRFGTKPGNKDIVQEIMRTVTSLAGENADKDDVFRYYCWYMRLVWNNDDLDISLLDLLNKSWLYLLKELVRKDMLNSFSLAINSLLKGQEYKPPDSAIIHLKRALSERDMPEAAAAIDSLHHLDGTILESRDVSSVIATLEKAESALGEASSNSSNAVNKIRAAAMYTYKYVWLQDWLFVLGAFAVFCERYKFIATLWDLLPGLDLDGQMFRRAFVPRYMLGCFRTFSWLFDHTINFSSIWHVSHGMRRYLGNYCLILLVRIISASSDDSKIGIAMRQEPAEAEKLRFLLNLVPQLEGSLSPADIHYLGFAPNVFFEGLHKVGAALERSLEE